MRRVPKAVAVYLFPLFLAPSGAFALDCNANGVDDAADIAGGSSSDCDANGLPDECQIDVTSPAPGGPFFCTAGCDPDCNASGVPDACELDSDQDGWIDACDNCPLDPNPDQADTDGDGLPDGCDPCLLDPFNDEDLDGICGDLDNCPTHYNTDQADCDDNGDGDACTIARCQSFDWYCQDENGNGVPDGCDYTLEEVLKIHRTLSGAQFGWSTAVDGNVVLVGAPTQSASGLTGAGVVHIYRYGGGAWTEAGELSVSDPGTSDNFGTAVAVSGDLAVVGAPNEEASGTPSNRGAVYVFRYDGAHWTEKAKLTASVANSSGYFGTSVAIAGGTVLVGSPGAPCGALSGCGRVYRFEFDGAGWVERQILGASDGGASHSFGGSIAVFGSKAVIGAPRHSCPSSPGSNCGAAYAFRRDALAWVEEAKLLPGTPTPGEFFGQSVALGPDQALVGAPESGSGVNGGAVYAFAYGGTAWSAPTVLTPSVSTRDDRFGAAVAISGAMALVGSPLDDCTTSTTNNCGAVHVFRRSGVTWTRTGRLLASDAAAGDQFGTVVAMGGATAVIGTPAARCASGSTNCGKAYIYFTGGQCVLSGSVTPPEQCDDGNLLDGDGCSTICAVEYGYACLGQPSFCGHDCDRNANPDVFDPNSDGDAVVDACDNCPFEPNNDQVDCDNDGNGDACEFDSDQDALLDDCENCPFVWNPDQEDCDNDGIGDACEIDADSDGLVDDCDNCPPVANVDQADCNGDGVGDACEPDADADGLPSACDNCPDVANAEQGDCDVDGVGDACVIAHCALDDVGCRDCDGNRVPDKCDLFSFDLTEFTATGASASQYFGDTVSLSGATAVVGAKGDRCGAEWCGAAHILRRVAGVWENEAKLVASERDPGSEFGAAVAIDRNVAVVGAPLDWCGSGRGWCGTVYVFRFDGNVWVEESRLHSAVAEWQGFGRAVAIEDDTVVVGAPGNSCIGLPDCGAVFVYRFDGRVWNETAKLTAPARVPREYFGAAVSVRRGRVLIGAPGTDYSRTVVIADAGAGYVFAFEGESWILKATVAPPEPAAYQNVGSDVSLGIDFAFLAGSGPDSVHVYREQQGVWSYQTRLRDPSGAPMGNRVSHSGRRVLVGASYPDYSPAYLFVETESGWELETRLIRPGGRLGYEVALDANVLAVGDGGHNCPGQRECGALYLAVGGKPDCDANSVADECEPDADGDGVPDPCDNCPHDANAGQPDFDSDGIGDICDGCSDDAANDADQDGLCQDVDPCPSDATPDIDSDGFCGLGDNCPSVANPEQIDTDADGPGDACDACPLDARNDFDDDGICDNVDVCPDDPYNDADRDTVCGDLDNCPEVTNAAQFDCDVDGVGDACTVADCPPGDPSCADCNANGVPDECDILTPILDQFTPPAARETDRIGFSISVDGDLVLVGAPNTDCPGETDCGAAYVLQKTDSGLEQQAVLTAWDAFSGDLFGQRVAISGDVAVIGSPSANCLAGVNCGAAYVFRRSGPQWLPEAKLVPADLTPMFGFGSAVAISGGRILVGADLTNCAVGLGCGAVYVFRADASGWIEDAKLTSPFPEAGARFGSSVALDADTALVGSYSKDCGSGSNCGTADVFRRDGETWVFEQGLWATPRQSGGWFAWSVALSGDVAIVGAPPTYCGLNPGCGAAYVFRRYAGTWTADGILTAPDAKANDNFGISVAVRGDAALVGANQHDCARSADCGAAYFFLYEDGRWTQHGKAESPDALAEHAGAAVALGGQGVGFVGAPDRPCNARPGCGGVYFMDLPAIDCNTDGVPDACQAGDPNGDGLVDLADYILLHACLTGPCSNGRCASGLPIDACCRSADLDGDRDMDLRDASRFHEVFRSP